MRLAVLAALMACGCPGGNTGVKRPYPEPTVEDLLARLAKVRDERKTFTADSTMDYWLANQRAKGEVLVMGTTGARVRFAALSPAGGSTLAEMACNGKDFVYVDYQNNCTLTGPCDQRSIAQFFRLELAPDDFVHLALGTPPVLAGATGTITWDPGQGLERVELTSPEGKQKLVIDARDAKLDVISSELIGTDGKVKWTVANTDFHDVDGQRLPGKTRFKSPAQQEDLLVEWGDDRKVNVELAPNKFELQAPPNLSTCGQQAPKPAKP